MWMFISSYEDLRKFIIDNTNIETLYKCGIFYGRSNCSFICSFVLNNDKK